MRRSVVAGVVFVAALSACGSTSDQASKVSTIQLVAASADAAATAGSARISGSATVTRDGKRISIPIDGLADFNSGAAEMRIELGALGLGVTGSVEARVVDHVMYMKFGDIFQGRDVPKMFATKEWLKLDLGQAGATSNGATQSPGSLLESLRGAGDVKEVGTEKIDGVETTHFTAHIDVRSAMEKVKSTRLRALAAEGLKQMGNSFPVDVWIDGEGLTRRVSVEIDNQGVSIAEVINFRDYGVKVQIDAPPAAATTDFASMMSSALGSNAS